MDIPTEQYLMYMEELFSTPGWSLLTEDAKDQINYLTDDAVQASSWEEVQRIRGRLEQLKEFLTMPQVIAVRRAEFDNAPV